MTSTGPDLMFLCRCGGFCAHPRPPGRAWTLSNGVLVNPQSGKCLDATGGSSASGTRLQLYTCGGTAAQRWTTPALPASRQTTEILSRGRFREGGAALLRAAAHLTLRRRHLNDRIVRLVDQWSG